MTPLAFAQTLVEDLVRSYPQMPNPTHAQLGDLVVDCAGTYATVTNLTEFAVGGQNCGFITMADMTFVVAHDCANVANDDGTTNWAQQDVVSIQMDADSTALWEWSEKQRAAAFAPTNPPSITFLIGGGVAMTTPRGAVACAVTIVDDSALSVMEKLALLEDPERDRLLTDLTPDDLTDPELWLRPDQLRAFHDTTPIVLMLAGRGAGKTRVGASWCNQKAYDMPGSIGHLVGRTVSDVRDVMVQGDSGILAVSAPSFTPEYLPSLRKLVWPNGSHALTFSSEKPAQLRGPQSHWTWVDELAALNHRPDDSGATAWDNIRIGTRLGHHPHIFATTTPKRIQAIRELVRLARTTARVSLHGASTLANRANLSAEYLKNLYLLYAGTALERQELYGELLDIVEAALWQPKDIRIGTLDWMAGVDTISVIGVDPGLTTGGDATGIVTVRSTDQLALTTRRAFVVADWTEEGLQPERWAARVVEAWRMEKDLTGNTPIIVAEKNAGGEMVASVIEAQAGDNVLPVALIPAKGTKAGRAEPIVMAYRQDRVRHLDLLPELVEELTGWEPPVPGVSRGSGWSPNRLDAVVHGLRACLVDDAPLRRFGTLEAQETSSVLTVPTAAWRRGASGTHGLRLPWRDDGES